MTAYPANMKIHYVASHMEIFKVNFFNFKKIIVLYFRVDKTYPKKFLQTFGHHRVE